MPASTNSLIIALGCIILSKGNNDAKPQILDVRDVIKDEYPYVVAFERKFPVGGTYRICTGTLISSTWVLSAAHCFVPVVYCVRFGDMTIPRNDTRYFREVLNMFPHPNFIDGALMMYNDIGLAFIRNIQLHSFGKLAAEDYRSYMGLPVIYVGFGLTSGPGYVADEIKPLQVGEGVVRSCSYYAGYSYPALCVAPKYKSNIQDSASGNSGGPLFCRDKIIGVVGSAIRPIGLYTPVSLYLDWIRLLMTTEEQKEKHRPKVDSLSNLII